MSPFIVFDVSDVAALASIRTAMLNLQYFSAWTHNGGTYFLPANTLWRSDGQQQQALDDLNSVIRNLNLTRNPNDQVTLLRCVVVQIQPWVGITGQSI